MTFSMDMNVLYIGSRPIATFDYAARYRAALIRYSPLLAEHIASGGLSYSVAWELGRSIGLFTA